MVDFNVQQNGLWTGGVTFGSHHTSNSIPGYPPVEVRTIDQHSYEVVIPIVSRPSCVLVGVLPNQRAVIANGNHRVVALLQAGHNEVPVLARPIQALAELGASADFDHAVLTNGPRPPTVRDYMDPAVSDELDLKAQNWILRAQVQTQSLAVPR